jgi:hypothetical protein
MGKQESMGDWFQMAKDYAKAEKELKIENWVQISICYGHGHQSVILYTYDLPREVYERRMWVIRWRVARLQCKYPRNDVYTSFYCYDKRSGESLEVSSCLSKLISAKAQITKAERRMNEYIEYNRQNNLFFDEESDEELAKFREKLERKKLECAECQKRLEKLVEKEEIYKRLIN